MSDKDIRETESFHGVVEQTGEHTFKADSVIIKNVSVARGVYENLRASHIPRMKLYAEIDGLIQGAPPYNPQTLRAAGLQHISNFNDMSARATIERACLGFWNLLNNAQYIATFILPGKQPEFLEYGEILSRNWDKTVKEEWPSFLVNVSSLMMQLVKYGISPVFFNDERDPKWQVVEVSKFFIPDQAQSDLDKLTTIFIETEYTLQYLWQVHQQFSDKPKDTSPWNTDAVGKLLVNASKTHLQIDSNDVTDLQKKMATNTSATSSLYTDTIKLVSMYQREYDGKVTRSIFHRNFDHSEFLYEENSQYKDMREALIIFTLSPGEYTLHGNKGLGHKIFSLAQAQIQVDCSVVDMIKWGSTPILKSPSTSSKDVEQIRFYPGVPTNIGTAELAQNNLGANVQHVITGAQYIQSKIKTNISYSGSDSADPDPSQGSISPSQVRIMAFNEFGVLKNSAAHFYTRFDEVLALQVSKMLRSKKGYPGYEMCQKWKERCYAEGVPEIVFKIPSKDQDDWRMPSNIQVKATRVAGSGSQVAHLMGLQELQAIVGSFSVREEREFKRQMISATIGSEYIGAFDQDGDDVDEKAGGATIAGLENAIMQAGKAPIFSPDNEHRSHFVTHMALAQQTVQMLSQKQMDVIEADSIFNTLVPHMGDHLQALGQNPFAQAFYSQARSSYTELERLATLNRKNAAKMAQKRIEDQQKLEEENQQVMSKEELENFKVQRDEARKDAKLSTSIERQEKAGDAKEAALFRKTEADISVNREKAKGDVEVKKMKAQLENTSQEELEADPSEYLKKLNGNTISPYDIEPT